MQSAGDIGNHKVRLLSSLELDDVLAVAHEIIETICTPKAVSVLMWDADLENFGDRFNFGARKKEFAKFADAFCEDDLPGKEQEISELDTDDFDVKLARELEPVICYKVLHESQLCAAILISCVEEMETADLLQELHLYPFGLAIHRSWEYRELQRENERLRSQYEEMEDKTSMLEQQTITLIHDMKARDSLRAREDALRNMQVNRDNLVYSISNAVRSSVHIQEVLTMTVEKIGTTLGVSRCLLLRSVESIDRVVVFEYHQPTIPAVRELFLSDAGCDFTGAALSKTSPHDLVDIELDNQLSYDKNFLRQLGIRSGLIVPLVLRERVVGVLFLQDCVQPRDWTIDDVSMLGSLADNLSVAIENAELHQEREQQAVTDGLTGVANRRSFNETFTREFERARRYGEPLSLIVIDLDFLKKINDTYGHQTGDEAIKAIGKMLKQSSRSVDLPARYGGEEFCLLLPNTDIEMAQQLAERVRRLICETDVEGPGHISASLGVACYPLHADDPDVLFHRADEALYAAKQGGRNQVKVASASHSGFDISEEAAPKEVLPNDAVKGRVEAASDADLNIV